MYKSLIFPGQGSQRVGMGKDLYENFIVAKEVRYTFAAVEYFAIRCDA